MFIGWLLLSWLPKGTWGRKWDFAFTVIRCLTALLICGINRFELERYRWLHIWDINKISGPIRASYVPELWPYSPKNSATDLGGLWVIHLAQKGKPEATVSNTQGATPIEVIWDGSNLPNLRSRAAAAALNETDQYSRACGMILALGRCPQLLVRCRLAAGT
jgi:hypothetical protein